MSLNHDIQCFGEDSYDIDPGVTTSWKSMSRDLGASRVRYWERRADPTQSAWEEEISAKLAKLRQFPIGWDGYNSPPMRYDVGVFALTVLKSVMQPQTPLPQVVPSAAGGVQFEWHQKGIDLEVNFVAPYECELWLEDHQTGVCIAKMLTNDFSEFKAAIELLATR